MKIEWSKETDVAGWHSYNVEAMVDDGENHHIFNTQAYHLREHYNVLALIRNLVDSMSEDQLTLKGPISAKSNQPTMGEIRSRFEQL